jgi:hypothetical protein
MAMRLPALFAAHNGPIESDTLAFIFFFNTFGIHAKVAPAGPSALRCQVLKLAS